MIVNVSCVYYVRVWVWVYVWASGGVKNSYNHALGVVRVGKGASSDGQKERGI